MDKQSKNSTQLPNDSDQAGIGRRSLVKGLASTPIIFTIASRPAWANRCSISGHLSGNLSDPNGTGESVECNYSVFGEESFSEGSSLNNLLWGSGILGSLSLKSFVINSLNVTADANLTIEDAIAGTAGENTKIEVLASLNAKIWEELTAHYNNQSSLATGATYMAMSDLEFFYPFTTMDIGGGSGAYRNGWSGFRKIT